MVRSNSSVPVFRLRLRVSCENLADVGRFALSTRLVFAGEKARADHLLPAPEIHSVKDPADFPVITLESLQ